MEIHCTFLIRELTLGKFWILALSGMIDRLEGNKTEQDFQLLRNGGEVNKSCGSEEGGSCKNHMQRRISRIQQLNRSNGK
jgi:hypothetical protein